MGIMSGLSVNPGYDRMQKAYVDERNAILTTDDLKAFIERWKTIWTLATWDYDAMSIEVADSMPYYKTYREHQSIIDGTLDLDTALKCLKACIAKQPCGHGDDYSCSGMHLALPYPLLWASMVSEEYGIPVDMAFVQCHGGFGEL